MRVFRTVVGVLVAVLAYAIAALLVSYLGRNIYDDLVTMLYNLAVAAAVPSFVAFAAAGLLAAREYRQILFGLQLYALYAYEIATYVRFDQGFWPVLGGIIHLSLAALGAYAAIVLTSNLGEARYRGKSGRARYGIPGFLTVLAFVSIPITDAVVFLSFFILLGVSALLLLVLLGLDGVPVVLLVGIGLAPLVSAWAAIKGLAVLFRPPVGVIVGLPIDLGHAPAFKSIITQVCRKIDTDLPDSVLVCAEPGAFVTQTTLKTLDERTVTGRILGVGGSLFYELEAQELASVLAHEFAHFTGKDTLYSRRVLPVFRTISSVLENLKLEGSGSSVELVINVLLLVPRFCIVTFVRYFAAIDSLLSRARELRADLLAAQTFGDQPFKSALAKLTRSLLFYHKKLEELKPSGNLFEHLHHQMESCAAEVHELAAEETKRRENEFDSHPSLQTRLDSLPRVEVDYLRNVSMRQVLEELSPTLERLSARLNLLFVTTETDEDDDQGEGGADAECADLEETE